MYSYITEELIDVIDLNFDVTASRGIFGHSMGGHGALVIGLKSQLFNSISAFSPICNPIQVPWGQKAFKEYLGEDKELWKQYDASILTKNYTGKSMEILVDQGCSDNFLHQLKPHSLIERSTPGSKLSFNIRMHAGYDHSYYFVSTFLKDHVKHHLKMLS
eukprot:TRINITY_DN1759_c0_g1_i3.p1 TRINITY_DN1759_c0_g1~~TRINITY_DN1759_c0_g1_i3.p1  ORF type:complete len:160 (-),score=24.32 TRINITY_DN1759_c0_g1_i3:26-505(-)